LIKKKTDLINDKMGEFEKVFTGKLESKVRECFGGLTESKFLELEDKTEKNLAVSRAKLNDMLSKFVQFQNVVNPTLSLVKEELEKLNTRLDKLKENQADLEEEVEETTKEMFTDLAETGIKEIREETTKFSESVNGRLGDLETEFVQFQNVINPTLNLLKNDLSKLDNRIEKLRTGEDEALKKAIDSIEEGMSSLAGRQGDFEKRILILGNKLGEIREEFNNIVKQSLIDRKKLGEESKKQRERINILLKELKSA